jgi:hypothetical protein
MYFKLSNTNLNVSSLLKTSKVKSATSKNPKNLFMRGVRFWCSLAEKLEVAPGSLEQGLAIESQARNEPDQNVAATLFLHAAGVLGPNSLDARRARHAGARCLLRCGRTEEALAELKQNLRSTLSSPVEHALARVSVGVAEVIRGNKADGIALLEESMHELHSRLGKVHPLSHKVMHLWLAVDLQDRGSTSFLIDHV